MRVPAATPTRLSPEERAAMDAGVRRVLDDGPWIGGAEVDAFEAEFGAVSGGHVVGCASGTDALVLALLGLGLAPGSTVLVPGHDGGYGATAARLAGMTPVAVDVDPVTGNPSLATLDAAGPADALVAVHLHGDPVALPDLDAWRRERGMLLIEDCAQAAGAHVGRTGDASAYSFYPTKNLGAAGDAGAVAFADPAHEATARSLAQYGWDDHRIITLPGGRNSRLDPLQASVLRARLPFLERRNERRRAIRRLYREAAPDLDFLGGDDGVAHHAVIRSDRRDELVTHLEEHGVSAAVHYPVAVADMPGLGLAGRDTPGARRLAGSIVSVPCTPELTEAEVSAVADALRGWTT